MLKANIETFLACDASYEEAGIVLYGAPFDSTTSYRPGTRFGSRAIRSESYGLESYSPYQDRDLTDYAVFDAGDQELCFGDASLALKDLRERAAQLGVRLGFLSDYAAVPNPAYAHTLVVNYAGLDPARLHETMALLSQIFSL